MDLHTPLYRTPTPEAYPSAQPRSSQSIISWDALCNLPSSPCPQGSQAADSTQSWDSQNGPRPASDLAATPQPPSPLSSSFFESLPGPPELEDSQAIASDQAESQASALSMLSHHLSYDRAIETTRDLRLMIRAGLLFQHSHKEIRKVLNVTEHQIEHAISKKHRLTPQKRNVGRNPLLHTPQKEILRNWRTSSPSHRFVPYKYIPDYLPQLHAGEEAIRTAFEDIGYCRRKAHKKGFSDRQDVMDERLAFAEEGVHWTRERVYRICFTDEIWAMGGAHTEAYVTVLQDGSYCYEPLNIMHKYSKAPAWMFHGSIVDGHKGPCCFWEKAWGSIDAEKYILIAQLCPNSG